METVNVNIDHLREWIGKTETREDRVTLTPIAALSATLDRDDPFPRDGDPLPPLWHWLYFLPDSSAIGTWCRRAPEARWFYSASAAAAPHVCGRAAAIPPAAARGR